MYTFFIFASNLGGLVSSYVYFSKNVSTDLEEALYALLQVVAFVGLFYIITTAILLRRKFTKFLNTLTNICEASEQFVHLIIVHYDFIWMNFYILLKKNLNYKA